MTKPPEWWMRQHMRNYEKRITGQKLAAHAPGPPRVERVQRGQRNALVVRQMWSAS